MVASQVNITLDQDVLNSIDMSKMEEYTKWVPSHTAYFSHDAGQEHYRLLTFLAGLLHNTSTKPMIDIGTYFGFSALALSSSPSSYVITYDVVDCIPDEHDDCLTIKSKTNIDFRITDCLNDIDTLCDADLICLDVDPHDGQQETEIIDALQETGYKGLLVLDDIHLNEDMERFWNSIKLPKIDVTKYGHHSGTGLVVFDTTKFKIELC